MNENVQFLVEKICTFKLNVCFIKFAVKFGVHFEQQPHKETKIFVTEIYSIKNFKKFNDFYFYLFQFYTFFDN
jgi:hypothetical protein